MEPREAREPRGPLVDFGVVFHRARPERIKLRVDAEVPLREPEEMPESLWLAHLRQTGGRFAREWAEERRGVDGRHVEGRKGRTRAPRRAALENGGLAKLNSPNRCAVHIWTISSLWRGRSARSCRRCSSNRASRGAA